MDALADFTWDVAPDYEWLTARWKEESIPYLFPDRASANLPRRSYRPLSKEHSALFRIFAATEITQAAVLEFARRYGFLGGDVTNYVKDERRSFVPGGELLWKPTGHSQKSRADEIVSMRFAVSILDAFKSEDVAGMEDALGQFSGLLEVLPPPDKSDIRSSALHLFRVFSDRHLRETVTAQLLPAPENDQLRLVLQPNSLLGAMWLQLAYAITENKQYPPCKTCGRIFEIAKGQTGYRTNREFCSDACKSKDYRARKGRAISLQAQGLSLKEIAEQTGSDIATVRGWITTETRKARR